LKSAGVIAVLIVLLAVGVGAMALGWLRLEDVEMSIHGWIALALGAGLSLALGAGLMALSFHSARAGFDDRAGGDDTPPD
jgi:hypothetical protein